MTSSLVKGSSIKNMMARGLSAQAAAALKQHSYSLAHHQPKLTKLPRGEVVASLENNSPIAQIAIYVKSGSRYEDYDNLGVSHITRLAVGLATKNLTAFMLTRKLQQMGANFVCENGREHMCYRISCMREHLPDTVRMLSDVAFRPTFKSWEMDTIKTRLMTELVAKDPTTEVLDLLHEAAFRNSGLGRSLFTPNYRVGRVTEGQLKEFIQSTHSASRTAFVGLGVDHDALIALVKSAPPPQDELGHESDAVSYKGGEIRRETGSGLSYVAVAGPGAKMGSPEAAAFGVAQCVLGGEPGVKYGANASGKLAELVATTGGSGIACAINASYTDAGLFGFLLTEQPDAAEQTVKAITKGIRGLKVSQADVEGAKKRAKAAVLMSSESTEIQVQEMGLQVLLKSQLSSTEDALKAIDNVTVEAVQAALSSVVKGKPSMVALGSIDNVPYLDQL